MPKEDKLDLVFKSNAVDASVLHALIDVLADAAGICAKLVDEAGEVVAVNRRGAALIGKQAEDICGASWSALWAQNTAPEARAALEQALDGATATFTGQLAGEDEPRAVRTLPLMAEGSGVRTVLALTSDAGARDRDIVMALPSALHAFANLANVSASSARLMKRGLDQDMTAQIAEDLGGAADRASAAIDDLRGLMDRDSETPAG